MRRQSAGEALGNFGNIFGRALLVIVVIVILIQLNSDGSESGDTVNTDNSSHINFLCSSLAAVKITKCLLLSSI